MDCCDPVNIHLCISEMDTLFKKNSIPERLEAKSGVSLETIEIGFGNAFFLGGWKIVETSAFVFDTAASFGGFGFFLRTLNGGRTGFLFGSLVLTESFSCGNPKGEEQTEGKSTDSRHIPILSVLKT